MDILPSIQSRSLFRGHLEEHPVSGPEQQHRAPGRLVQEALLVLVIRVHHGLVVLEQSNPHVAPLAVNVVCKVVDPRDLTGEDARLRVVVLSAVIEQFVKLHWGPHRWERRSQLSGKCRHLVGWPSVLAFLSPIGVGGFHSVNSQPHIG